MMPSTLMMLFLAASALSGRAPDPAALLATGAASARYDDGARTISNWRGETAATLEPRALALFVSAFDAGRPVVTRCVKLNNYWCIKSARWEGEVGKDSEGHVAFATAAHGADAAVALLRRYYVDYGRKSALDIVRRWAPAECGVASDLGGLAVLAVKGIGGTVRARYLASRRGRGVTTFTAKGRGGKPGRVSMVIPLKTPQYRVPDIAAGMGERAKPTPPPPPTARTRAPKTPPAATAAADFGCAPDERRLQNYAGRIVADLPVGPKDDLALFAPDGTPSARLATVLRAMASFELGMLSPTAGLIDGAVRRAILRAETAKEAAREPVTAP